MGTSADIGTGVDGVGKLSDGKCCDIVREVVDFDTGSIIWDFTGKKEES